VLFRSYIQINDNKAQWYSFVYYKILYMNRMV
jgi:hypothetical protein